MAKQKVSASHLGADLQPTLSAQLVVKDLKAAVEFYQKAFGFDEILDIEQTHALDPSCERLVNCNGLAIHLISEAHAHALSGYLAQSPASLNTLSPTIITVLCQDIEARYNQALRAGATTLQSPHRSPSGARTFLVSGAENYVWRFIDTLGLIKK